jgi:hypothetical protein
VGRRDVIAIMGESGSGANRAGAAHVTHLHVTLYGPIYSPMYAGIAVQEWPKASPAFRNVLDPEEFSLAGKGDCLPYSHPADAEDLDKPSLTTHAEAVAFSDWLLDRFDDVDAVTVRVLRKVWETRTQFDAHVDERIWYIWERLKTDKHPFTGAQVAEYQARLKEFMLTVPRLTSPIVEPERQDEYRWPRSSPLKRYEQALPKTPR